jgi:DNA-binding transcriptional regulator YiaG
MSKLTPAQAKTQRTHMMQILKLLGVSQVELSVMLGVSESMVSKWVSAFSHISPRSAMRLSKLCPEIPPEKLCPDLYKNMN